MEKVLSESDEKEDEKIIKLLEKIRAQKLSSKQCSQQLIDQINKLLENELHIQEREYQKLKKINKRIVQLQKAKRKRELIKLLKQKDEQFKKKLSLLQTFNQYNQNNLVERSIKKVLVIGEVDSGKTSLISSLCNSPLTNKEYERLSQIKQMKQDRENKLIYFDSPPLWNDLVIFQENFLKNIYEMDSIIVVSDRGFSGIITKLIQVLAKINHPKFFLVRTKCDLFDGIQLQQIKKEDEKHIQKILGVKKKIIYFSTKSQNFLEENKQLKNILRSNNSNLDIVQERPTYYSSTAETQNIRYSSQNVENRQLFAKEQAEPNEEFDVQKELISLLEKFHITEEQEIKECLELFQTNVMMLKKMPDRVDRKLFSQELDELIKKQNILLKGEFLSNQRPFASRNPKHPTNLGSIDLNKQIISLNAAPYLSLPQPAEETPKNLKKNKVKKYEEETLKAEPLTKQQSRYSYDLTNEQTKGLPSANQPIC